MDPLLDDSVQMAYRLRQGGNKAKVRVFEGLCHGFLHFGLASKACADAVQELGAVLRDIIDNPGDIKLTGTSAGDQTTGGAACGQPNTKGSTDCQ